jgi:hypothetical protein
MPALFTLPKIVALSATNQILPGARIYFYQSGTSTPQPTYQDIALTVPHANPVVADGAGAVNAIYLDPSLPSYRVILADSADVTQPGYPIDDYPSNQNAGQTYRLKSAAPELIFEETDAAAGNQKWRLRVNSQQLTIDLLNDAESVATTIATFTRSGTTITAVNFAADVLQNNSKTVLSRDSTTAEVTLTGCTTSPTRNVDCQKIGVGTGAELIIISIDVGVLTGTSNTTAMSITGIPSGYRPKTGDSAFCFVYVTDNGVSRGAKATLNTSGVMSFGLGIDGADAFTNSGTKGLPNRFVFMTVLD